MFVTVLYHITGYYNVEFNDNNGNKRYENDDKPCKGR